MKFWPIRTAPLPDESLSSWLSRSALALGTDTSTLVRTLKSSWRPWTSDLDRRGPRNQAELIVERSGIDQSAINGMTLQPIAEKISGPNIAKKDRWPWILMLGIRGRDRQFGTQYCSACLRSDPTPYFRRNWRLAWHVVCAQHSMQLSDACPSCNSQIEPHRSRQTDKHIALCWQCNADLASTAAYSAAGSVPHIQLQLDHALSELQPPQPSHARRNEFVYYARLIASLRRSMASPTATNPSFEYLGDVGKKLRTLKVRPVSFELLRTSERYQLLRVTHDLRTVYGTFNAASWSRDIPSDLRRALEGSQHRPSGKPDKVAKKPAIGRMVIAKKLVILPRPRSDVARIWRRLKLRAHARHKD